jgi:hypothetical protein
VSVVWLAPLALTGLALVALPILIHLLARHRSRRLLFPTLRFLPTSQLAALRRRSIADWPLLVVRVLIITAAVIAAAAPVFVSAARRAAWDARLARAIVVTGNTPEIEALADEEARPRHGSRRSRPHRAKSSSSAIFERARLPRPTWMSFRLRLACDSCRSVLVT